VKQVISRIMRQYHVSCRHYYTKLSINSFSVIGLRTALLYPS
jgi:hypothetical protein